MEVATRFREQFDGYRSDGIFVKKTGGPTKGASSSPGDTQISASENNSKHCAELERKIKDLVAQMEAVMASSLPGMEKMQ